MQALVEWIGQDWALASLSNGFAFVGMAPIPPVPDGRATSWGPQAAIPLSALAQPDARFPGGLACAVQRNSPLKTSLPERGGSLTKASAGIIA